jgi:glutaredoxin
LTPIKFHFCILFSFAKDDDTLGWFMKGLIVCGFWLSVLFSSFAYSQQTDADALQDLSCTSIEVFSSQGCPHCKAAYQGLDNLTSSYPQLRVSKRDIQQTEANWTRFVSLNETHKIDKPGVPAFYMCGHFWVGFDHVLTPQQILIYSGLETTKRRNELSPVNSVRMPIFGDITAQQYGLPLFTVITGLLDGINPCAMWVLMFLLSMLVNVRSRKRMVIIAGTFVMVSGVVYFAFMAAWLNLFIIIGISRNVQILIAAVAIVIGSINLKDYFAFKKGLTLGIPETSKSGLYQKVRNIVQAQNMTAALLGVVMVAVLVNLLELICTAGLPAIYTQVLSLQKLQPMEYYAYLLLYNLAYIFDDALMVSVVLITLHKYKMSERQGRGLKLISGGFIIALGLMLLLMPEYLF